MNVTEESQGAGAAAQAAYREKQQQSMMQSFASTSTDHIQSTVAQQQQQQANGTGTTDTYDMSSYDPLQAHAYQLSACAGYTGAAATSSSNGTNTTNANGQQQQPLAPAPTQQQQQPVPVQPRQAEQQQQQQQVFYYAPQQQQQQQQQGVSYSIAPMPTQQQQQQQVMNTTAQPVPVNGAPQHQYYMTPAPIPQQYGVLQPQGSTASVVSAKSQQQAQPNYGQAAVNDNNKRSLAATPTSMMSSSNKRQQMTTIPGSVFPPQMAGGANLIKQELVAPPHVPSASTSSSIAGIDDDDIDPIHRKPPPNYATMTADEKRRYDRNIREQQRSFKISQQIKELRNVLAESSIPFKPNKFSILMRVVEYIKQLQSRAIMLDAEHRKLIDTIQQTSDMVNAGQTPDDSSSSTQAENAPIGNDAELMLVQGLDYKSIFAQCSAGLGVAALDGRILACNEEFAAISGFTKEDMLRQSVFNLMQNHEVVFRAMGEMLSNSSTPEENDKNGIPPAPPLYWSGAVNQENQNLFMNITLTKSKDGLPKFFNCALTATN